MKSSVNMTDDDLNWQIERACLVGCPAATEAVVDGWLLRQSGGKIRRINSANPLRGDRAAPEAVLGAIEAFYGDRQQTPLFRVPDIAGEMDAALDRHGYDTEGGTIHLFGGIDDLADIRDEQVAVAATPDEGWFAARFRMGSYDDAERRVFRAMTGRIAGNRAFVSMQRDGLVVAIAYGVIHDRLLVLESVETDGGFRQQGLGRRTVGGLIDWARRQGASAGCLQVVADNAPGRALYASLGFKRELYRYHYRRKAIAG
jgi:ribosomal protein S18 acetylase RimI-like enzyme